jgi:hypothetical protein
LTHIYGKILPKTEYGKFIDQQGYSILAVRILPGECPVLGIWGSGFKIKIDLISIALPLLICFA